jgi:galactitol-specific phosphotransferase system IIB component
MFYQLMSNEMMVTTNLRELFAKLISRLKMKHENMDYIIDFYFREDIIMDAAHLRSVERQVLMLSSSFIIKQKIRVLTAVLKHAVNSKECQPCTVSFFGQQD